jgi:hypothetical protein
MAVSLSTENLPLPNEQPMATIAAHTAHTGNCHISQQPGHWSADCPHWKKPAPTRPHQNNNSKFNIPPHPYNPSPGYHPYCPIVVAPNFLPYGTTYLYPSNFPTPQFTSQNQSPCQHITQSRSYAPNEQPYDSYKPNRAKKDPPIVACNVDVGYVKDKIAKLQIAGAATAAAISTNTKIILDTGASSHLTGDRSALFNFQVLSKPIPLRVATDSCNDFITGTGTMIFPGKNGTTVSVNSVMYCEKARSTLILPEALRRAKMIIEYNFSTDTFLFKLPLGKTLIEIPIDSKRRSWTFPQPIRHGSVLLPVSTPPDNVSSPCALVSKPKNPAKAPTELFPFPISKHEFDWHATDINENEMKLLFWHCLFGHAGLRRICKMIKLKLGVGLPNDIPKGDIKFPKD